MADEREDRVRRRKDPYEPIHELLGDLAGELLDGSVRDGKVHILTLARLVLEELISDGLSYVKVTEPAENIRSVRIGGKQEVWLGFDTYRDHEGYMAIDVVDAPRSDAAILAAMTAFLMKPVDRERLERALEFRFSEDRAALAKQYAALQKREEEGRELSGAELALKAKINLELGRNATELQPLRYALPLLLHYKPELRDKPFQDQLEYAWKLTHYANNFLKSLRNLRDFLQYGAPDRRLTPAIKQPERDVRAAVLHYVEGWSYRAIGEELNVPDPPDIGIKRDHQTVRKMVANGRLVLEGAFGAKGWQDRAETMKAQRAWWQTLSAADKKKELELESIARGLGMSIEEARHRVERDDT